MSRSTDKVVKGCSFEEFVWDSAAGIEPVASLKNSQRGPGPFLPKQFGLNARYLEQMTDRRKELERLENLTDAEVAAEVEADHRKALDVHHKDARERELGISKLKAMHAEVLARWSLPSPEYDMLRLTLLNSLERAIDEKQKPHSYYDHPRKRSPQTWLEDRIAWCEREITYQERAHAEEVRKTEEANKWLRVLRENIPQPQGE